MVDFIMKLPVVARKNAILVVCDQLSKMTHLVATTEGTLTEDLARLFRDNVWKLHRLPESVVLLGTVHTRVEVYRIDLEMSGLVE